MNWDLTKIYLTDEEFSKACEEVTNMVNEISAFEGKLKDKDVFIQLLKLQRDIEINLSKVYLYAHLGSDLNKKDLAKMSLLNKVMVIIQAYGQKSSYIEPELLSIGYDAVMGNLTDEVAEFRFILEKMFHQYCM